MKLLKYQSFHSANWTQAQIRGDYGTHVEVNNSGKNIVLTFIDPDNPDVATEAYYFDMSSLTYHRGDYHSLGDIFQPDNAIGYVMAGGSIRTSKYVCEEEEWAVFEKYD